MAIPILSVDLNLPAPVYRQIADGLRQLLVADDGPQPGEQLQTVRGLATDLGVHHNTVAQAYRLLAEEGWLELVRGRGAVVRDRKRPRVGADVRQGFQRRLASLVSEGRAQGLSPRWLAGELTRRANAMEGVKP